MEGRPQHLAEIDWLKGFAIASVVCIHAKPFSNTWLFDRITNRAVPIFLVLFGITSELALGARERAGGPRSALWKWWFAGRFERLLVPYWALCIAWWAVAGLSGYAAFLGLGARELALTFLGYAPWIGTSWFVTIVLQLVVLLPPWRAIARRLRAVPALAVSAAVTSASAYYLWNIVEEGKILFGNDAPEPGWYYQWIFSPRVLWHVTAGLFVARLWGGRVGPRATAVLSAMTLVGFWLVGVARGAPEDAFIGSLRQQAVQYLVDVPLSLSLLGLFAWLPGGSLFARGLGWLGRASWGIYLGHLWVHETLHAMHWDPERFPDGVRVIYAVFLLLSGSALAAAGSFIGTRLGIVRKRKAPLSASSSSEASP